MSQQQQQQQPGVPGYSDNQQQDFGQFDYSQGGQQPYDAYSAPSDYTGSIMTPDTSSAPYTGSESFEDEPPLMEELGINFEHIIQKTLTVLNPLKKPDSSIMNDTDLAGPLVFCLAFGGCLLLSGKIHFGYIYGIGVLGCLAMYGLLNMMSMTGTSGACIVSVLGYCLLPMVLLSSISIVLSLKGAIGTVSTVSAVLWCSYSASKLFVSALAMEQSQLLVAYPCALIYGIFALITIF
ncbi:unnamed protein product [Owenia fusiformis]|nr:unnamed protein product [Owenia fusiformis]